MFLLEKKIDRKIQMLSSTKVAVMANAASRVAAVVVVVTVVVDVVVLYIANMNRGEISIIQYILRIL